MFRMSQLASRDRHVIRLLRGDDAAAEAGELLNLFHQFRSAVSAIGFRPSPIGCVYVSRHELCLLGILAGLQRNNPSMTIKISKAVHPIALACARRLAQEDLALAHASLARLSGLTETCEDMSVSISPIAHLARETMRPPHPPLPGTLQAKALGFARGRSETSSRDFASFGVSRQVVSLMFKRGVLIRVRAGIYRAASETVGG